MGKKLCTLIIFSEFVDIWTF